MFTIKMGATDTKDLGSAEFRRRARMHIYFTVASALYQPRVTSASEHTSKTRQGKENYQS
jgi:hypothetical protein